MTKQPATVDVTYVGPHDAVDVVAQGAGVTVPHGATVTVTFDEAYGDPVAGFGGFLDQPSNWVAGHGEKE